MPPKNGHQESFYGWKIDKHKWEDTFFPSYIEFLDMVAKKFRSSDHKPATVNFNENFFSSSQRVAYIKINPDSYVDQLVKKTNFGIWIDFYIWFG